MNAHAATVDDVSVAASRVFKKRAKSSWLVAGVAHAALGGALVVLAIVHERGQRREETRRTLVAFESARTPPREQPREPPPPPPPPPVRIPRPRPVARPTPRPAPPPPAPEPVAPPPVLTAPSTGNSGNAVATGNNAHYRGGATRVGGREGAVGGTGETPAPEPVVPAPPPPPAPPPGPVRLPENATAPEPLASNAAPEFPSEASAAGVQGEVIARLVINAEGEVERVDILRTPPQFGELFAEAVRRRLRSWRYTPARYEGNALTVYHIVRIPFRLENM